jgi:ribosomal-protein-alanine N-acetyltransferase
MQPQLIRPYERSDQDACLQCFQSNVPASFTQSEIEEYRCWLHELSKADPDLDPDTTLRYYVILSANQLVGCGGFAVEEEKKKVVFAWGLVHRSYHKRGFGKALALYRLNEIESGYPAFDILLDTTQHTYGFFEKLGFRTELITPDFYAKGLDRYDMRRSAG